MTDIPHSDTGTAVSFGDHSVDYISDDPESRAAAISKLESLIRPEIEAKEARAGRKLSLKELLHGVKHVDDRTSTEKVLDEIWQPTESPKEEQPVPNPFRGGPAWRRKPETQDEMFARAADEFDKKYNTPAEEETVSKRRAEARAEAERLYQAALYDPNAPASVVAAAHKLTRQVDADLDVYDAMRADFVAAREAEKDSRVSDLDAQIAELQRRKAELKR